MELSKSVQFIKGVGPETVKKLNKLDIVTINDLLYHFPRNYEDRTAIKKINELLDGESTCFKGVISSRVVEITPRKNLSIVKVFVKDETDKVELVWFNQRHLKTMLNVGQEYIFYGKVIRNYKEFSVSSPIFEKPNENKNMGKIVPVYPLSSDISQNIFRKYIRNALDMVNNKISEYMPLDIKNKYRLSDINYCINNIHYPETFGDFNLARYRLVFEELFIFLVGLSKLRNIFENQNNGIKFKKALEIEKLINTLPFSLTGAQTRVVNEIIKDMESAKPMNRLIQGDVGSGKTVVAAIALLNAVKNGYQGSLMAPTGILAAQHFETLTNLLKPFNIRVCLLSGSVTPKKKKEAYEAIKNHDIDIVVGTHAIIEDKVEFNNLGLVVTDEQHRFGVRQRLTLSQKGINPDVLVMTATPIPRTLALILYGDLDISIIDELPPNRKSIETYAVGKDMENRINAFIKKQLDEKRQAYVVCPLVEDSEAIDAKSVTSLVDDYKNVYFREYRVEYLHGKMSNSQKDLIMGQFSKGEIDILISTTVIEVGVNVPNATVMIVENAERFGLAQLHQLRGRVGRGEHKSYCVLKCYNNSEVTKLRMDVMQNTQDGFVISQKDLEIRGPGEFFGTRQHGLPEFKIANLFIDIEILKQAQIAVKEFLALKGINENAFYLKIQNIFKSKFNEIRDTSL